jgi:hypothetical protein
MSTKKKQSPKKTPPNRRSNKLSLSEAIQTALCRDIEEQEGIVTFAIAKCAKGRNPQQVEDIYGKANTKLRTAIQSKITHWKTIFRSDPREYLELCRKYKTPPHPSTAAAAAALIQVLESAAQVVEPSPPPSPTPTPQTRSTYETPPRSQNIRRREVRIISPQNPYTSPLSQNTFRKARTMPSKRNTANTTSDYDGTFLLR